MIRSKLTSRTSIVPTVLGPVRMQIDFAIRHLSLLIELWGFFAIFAGIVVVCGALIARFDRISFEDGLYLAAITAFTVGFGDVAPKSRSARLVTVVLAFAGLVLVGVLVAIAVHSLGLSSSNQDLTPP